MVITELLEKNARLYGEEISLVEINPSEARDRAVTWRDYSLIESAGTDAPYRRELSWGEFDKRAKRSPTASTLRTWRCSCSVPRSPTASSRCSAGSAG